MSVVTGERQPVELEDLPSGRREFLLWKYALWMSYEDIAQDVRERSTGPCLIGQGWDDVHPEAVATLGDDGRFHRVVDGVAACGGFGGTVKRQGPDAWRHEQQCLWWTDGGRYVIHRPAVGTPYERPIDETGDEYRRIHRWTVRLLNETPPPEEVPPARRCPFDGPTTWPMWNNPRSAVAKVRRLLIEHLGANCHACRRLPGRLVDHDHFTGRVRGLLCLVCNTHADRCPHLTDCAWAAYLDDPPGWRLNLTYPRARAARRQARRKIAELGFDPYEF